MASADLVQPTPITLDGRYVRLEPLTLAHEAALNEAAADGELWNTDVTIIPRAEGMKEYIQAALTGLDRGFELPFVIVRKDIRERANTGNAGAPRANGAVARPSGRAQNEKIVGTTRFYEIFANDRKAAIGYTWLAQSAQRTPVNTEAKLLLLRHAFETWKFVRVELITDVLNAQSRAAILRLGAKQEGILRNHLILPSGRIRDSVVFSIIDSEWPEVKARLESRLAASRD
jgi:N-acetyltransferase